MILNEHLCVSGWENSIPLIWYSHPNLDRPRLDTYQALEPDEMCQAMQNLHSRCYHDYTIVYLSKPRSMDAARAKVDATSLPSTTCQRLHESHLYAGLPKRPRKSPPTICPPLIFWSRTYLMIKPLIICGLGHAPRTPYSPPSCQESRWIDN